MNTPKKFNDETIISTPKPAATSTVQRPQSTAHYKINKIPLIYSPESTTKTSVSDIDLTPCIDNVDNPQDTCNETLKQQRILTNKLLEKTKWIGLPSRYLKPSDTLQSSAKGSSDSTLNESDVLQPRFKTQAIEFTPDDISTPRSSEVSEISHSFIQHANTSSISQSIAELSAQIQNSNYSLADLCNKYCSFSLCNNSNKEGNEESFTPAEFAEAKLKAHEESWQKEFGLISGKSTSNESFFANNRSTQEDSKSLTRFFQLKSDFPEICLKASPEKPKQPIPLTDTSSFLETTDKLDELFKNNDKHFLNNTSDSTINISQLEKEMSFGDNTTNIMKYIRKTGSKKSTSPKPPETIVKYLPNKISENSEFKENVPPNKIPSNENRIKFIEPITVKSPNSTYFDSTEEKSTSSLGTAMSLESLPGGKLPIETNRVELVWGCVKIGKRHIETFTLRNKSQRKLRLQISSSNSNFRLMSDQSELESSSQLALLLYPLESRLITVVFTPACIGAIIGKLNFSPMCKDLQNQHVKRQQLMLYAYGGHSHIEIQNILKDTTMKMWLSLGKLNNRSLLNQKFIIQNCGNLPMFVLVLFGSKALYGQSGVSICPKEIVLQPKQSTTIVINYTPTKEDAKRLFNSNSNEVLELGYIQMINGAEALRGRIRRLCKKLKHYGNIDNLLLEKLNNQFPNEAIPQDVNQINETVGAMKTLMQNINTKEIILTVEKDTDSTLVGQIGGLDDTTIFQSLCEGMSTIVSSKTIVSSCLVEPKSLVLTPPRKVEDTVLIISQSNSSLQYEVTLMPADVLNVAPSQGIIRPEETVLLTISCKKNMQDKKNVKLLVYVDNDVFEIDIKVFYLKS